jgi:urease accessory protein
MITSSPNKSADPSGKVTGTSIGGHLHLTCGTRADGTPFISKQSFSTPVHIGKGHLDQGKLVLNIANPTAGFFDGDHLDSEILVESGAHLVLSTPAASRVYQSRSGSPAANRQRFSVQENASLEWIPEPFIPHSGASYRQTTKIELHGSASLLFFEWIAPGRVAKDEVFAYRNLRWEFELSLDGKPVAIERYELCPENHSLEALRNPFPAAHYLSVYAAGDMARNWPGNELDAIAGDDIRLGHGPLSGGVHVIRALCRDSLAARRLLARIRPLLYAQAGQTPPGLGHIFC